MIHRIGGAISVEYISLQQERLMRTLRRLLAAFCMVSVLSACTLNSAQPIYNPVSRTDPKYAIVIFGVGKGPDGPDRALSFQLDEFSLDKQKITGDCFRYNRLEVRTKPATSQIQYFAFRAPAGHYVLSPFYGQHFRDGPDLRFHAPAGVVSYLGDFVLVGERLIERMDTKAAADRYAQQLNLGATATAKTTPINGRGPIFACTP